MVNYNNINAANKQVYFAGQGSDLHSQFDSDYTEWAQLAPGKVVVATVDRAWLYQPQSVADRFAQPMSCAGRFATTKKLLDTAIAAAKYAIKSDVRPPALTATRWVWRLAGLYHLCHPIPPLVKKAQKQFKATKRWNLEQWAARNAVEEEGHDLLALKDIQSLGYDAQRVVDVLVPPATKSLIDYLTRSVDDSDPIDCVGYAYAMERLALGVDDKYIKEVEALLPQNIKATRCLRVHSSIGADLEHVDETVKMVAKLSALERTRVAVACYETALLCFSPPTNGHISDEEIQQILRPLKSNL